jgi:DNA polymerase elongation subunit (family B)
MDQQTRDLIYGKDPTERVVCVEADEDFFTIFTEDEKGNVNEEIRSSSYWLLTPAKYSQNASRLKGNQFYKYISHFSTKKEKIIAVGSLKKSNKDYYTMWDDKESILVNKGITYFKGLKPQDVSVLFFDIESTGLVKDDTSKVLLIANTFRRNGKITKKMFCYDDFESEADMFDAWCEWVRKMNPSIVCGHNIISYDLPYMAHCAQKAGTGLRLGRDESYMTFSDFPSQFRKDGSQTYTFNEVKIFGREVVDTMFLAIKYDIKRKYESYGLKSIIAQEGLEKENREFYDASKIKDNYKIPEEWKKIKKYAKDDADDALSLYDLMIPSFFYFAQNIPKPFQMIINKATGSQINSFLVRSYLQLNHSIPKASEVTSSYEGAISFGVAGRYKNCLKLDIASLYPSIIEQYEVYDKYKDPLKHFLKAVQIFREQRLLNKQKFKETKDKYYEDLSESMKISINSMYGFMGTNGLNFNSPANAAFVTEMGRNILEQGIKFATNQSAEYWKNIKNEESEELEDDEL